MEFPFRKKKKVRNLASQSEYMLSLCPLLHLSLFGYFQQPILGHTLPFVSVS
jgi:hypothetical protein